MRRNHVSSSKRSSARKLSMELLETRVFMSGTGLIAQYYNTADLSGSPITRTDATVNFDWENGAPDNSLSPDGYSARWSGKLQAVYSETYTFTVTAEGGARLWVNNVLLIDQWSSTSGTWSGSTALTAGQKYSITLEYAEKTGDASVGLQWSSPSQTPQVIPTAQLYAWSDADLGTITAGSSSYEAASGTYTVQGAGSGVLGGADNCHFTYQPITGDGEIIVQVTGGGSAGVMMKESLTAGAKSATLLAVNGGQQWMVTRSATGSLTGGVGGIFSFPVWLRLVRKGDVFTGYTSTDGQAWEVVWSGQTASMNQTLYVGMFTYSGDSSLATTTFQNVTVSSPRWDYDTSWIGNSYGGPNAWVQNDVKGMYVASDGTVFVNSPYDEGGHEAAMYKDGAFVGALKDLHGWGRGGGWAITADANYVYLTMGQGNPGWSEPANYPESNTWWNCVRRYDRTTLKPAGFTGGAGSDHSMLIVNDGGGTLRGLWLSGTELFVADKDADLVKVYSTVDMSFLRQFSVESPQQICEDQAGYLWIISNPSGGSPSVLRYSKAGVQQSQQITDVTTPTSVYVNPANGQLLIADDGPSQQIKVYNISGTTPALTGAIGQYGGIAAGTVPGEVSPTKFDNPMVVGADSSGNIYVGFNGMHPSLLTAIGLGSVIRSFSPSLSLNWEFHGLEFVDVAAVDPASDGLDVYTVHEHFTMDYSQTNGQEATWVGQTVAEDVYGNDSRVQGFASSMWLQRINGELFMFATSQGGGGIDIYRYVDGTEFAVHCGAISEYWVVGNKAYASIWRDVNGDAQEQTGERTLLNLPGQGDSFGWNIDTQGNIWSTANNGAYIRKYQFLGLDNNGSPIYESAVLYSVPSGIWNACQSLYVPETDTMYISAYTELYPKLSTDPTWGSAGRELLRYDNWSTNPTLTWRTAYPYDVTNTAAPTIMKTVALAGNRLFAAQVTTGTVMAYDTATGENVATMPRGPEVGGLGGWLDTLQAINAYRRSNGEYLVFVEDDLLGKVTMMRAGGITPSGLTATQTGTGQISLSWTDECSRESGFVIEQSTDGVNYTELVTLPANMTTYAVSGLSSGVNYLFRVKATNSFDDSPYTAPLSVYLPPATTAPTALSATAASGQVSLAWTDNATSETGYRIERSTDRSFATGVTAISLPANQTSYVDTGLSALTTYYYRVYAVSGQTSLGYSQTISATTLQVTPQAPTGLIVSPVSGTEISLNWTDNSANELGFVIQRATDLGFTQNVTQVLYSAPNLTNFVDRGLSASTTYYYRVLARNTAGDSTFSNPSSTRTLAGASATLGLFASNVDVGSVGVAGTSQAGDGVYVISGSGADIWNAADAFQYLYNTVNGDITMTARIDSMTYTNEWAKSGIMFRGSSAANSAFAFIGIRNSGEVVFQWRTTDGANASDSGLLLGGTGYGKWVRLVRSGNTFTAFYSTDGATWNQAGSTQTITMASSVMTGLIECSHDNGTRGTATITNVSASVATAPTSVTLSASSDTGTVGDGITSKNNVSSGSALTFEVAGTAIGATIYLYADGLLVGTATATGTTTSVTTDGATLLADGVHNFTAQQIVSGWPASARSSATAITIQTLTAPSGLSATATSSSQINLAWTDNATAETGFEIDRATNASFTTGLVTVTTSANAVSYSVTGLSPTTTYYFRVRAVNGAQTSDYTSVVSATTQAIPVPAAPTALSASAVSQNRITLAWTDSSTTETGFKVERATTADFAQGLTLLTTTAADVVSYTDTTAATGTTYYYRVRATNAGGDSANTDVVSATTWASNDVGSVAATGSSSYSNGVFSVSGSGADVWSTYEGFHFVSHAFSGDLEIITRVVSSTATHEWAKSGLMVRESLSAGAKLYAVELTTSHGAETLQRSTTGGTISTAAGNSSGSWLRLRRQGDVFTAYQSTNGTTWISIGTTTLSMSSTVYVGLMVCSHVDGTLATTTFDNVALTPATTTAGKLTGTVIGTSGSYGNSGNTVAKVFDGSLTTFFDAPSATGWAGLDLGNQKTIATIKFAPREGYASRMVGGYFQVSNTADFSSATTIYTIASSPTQGVLTSVDVSVSGTWRYVRYVGPDASYVNVSELEFWGY